MPQPLITSRLQRRRAFFRRLRIYGYISGAFLILLFIAYLTIASPLFKITSLTITGAPAESEDLLRTGITSKILERRVSGFFGPEHYFAWPNKLAYTSPLIKDITIKKSFWSRSVLITITPRQRFAVWCPTASGTTDCFWIDETGILFEAVPEPEGQIFYTLYDETGETKRFGDFISTQKMIAVTEKILSGLRETGLLVNKLRVNYNERELTAIIEPNIRVLFSTTFDPTTTAIPALKDFIEKSKQKKIDYINLTVEHRAYVKYK